jgi:hypothetical protein
LFKGGRATERERKSIAGLAVHNTRKLNNNDAFKFTSRSRLSRLWEARGELLRNCAFGVGHGKNITTAKKETDSVTFGLLIRGRVLSHERGILMKAHSYSSDELQSFYRVLDRVVTEVAERELLLPVYAMIQRLFHAADRGERGHELLRMAILREDADAGRRAA